MFAEGVGEQAIKVSDQTEAGLQAWMFSKDQEVEVLRVLEGSLLGQKSNLFHIPLPLV